MINMGKKYVCEVNRMSNDVRSKKVDIMSGMGRLNASDRGWRGIKEENKSYKS